MKINEIILEIWAPWAPWDPGPYGTHGPGPWAQKVVIDFQKIKKSKIEMRARDLSKKNRGEISRRGV